jgi:hypothetical protein
LLSWSVFLFWWQLIVEAVRANPCKATC